ncbi:MAG: pyridoxal 5'-phosphate synthase glutaminase subunit PdxT [Chloroflexi bacterium]|nr:pyridoxal 5'-phosphate synthase glutaminase subunit PdxT [Chloroflexota bacterium]
MKVGVLALQGDFQEHAAVLRRLGVEVVEVRQPEDMEGVGGLIIPGGESTTITRLLHRYGLVIPLRERIRQGMPVLGTCAGMIVLAKEARGLDREGLEVMDIVVQRNAFGRQIDSFEADIPIPALGGDPFHAVFIRAPIIEEVQAPGEALATLEDGTVVAAREGNMLVLAFHPELTADTRMHTYFLELVRTAAAETGLKEPSKK